LSQLSSRPRLNVQTKDIVRSLSDLSRFFVGLGTK